MAGCGVVQSFIGALLFGVHIEVDDQLCDSFVHITCGGKRKRGLSLDLPISVLAGRGMLVMPTLSCPARGIGGWSERGWSRFLRSFGTFLPNGVICKGVGGQGQLTSVWFSVPFSAWCFLPRGWKANCQLIKCPKKITLLKLAAQIPK